MMALDQPRFKAADFFVLRTPLLDATAYIGATPEQALEDPILREAIGLASPSLLEEAGRENGNRDKVRLGLARYLARMRGRPTPFSLLAGYTHGPIGERSVVLRLGPIGEAIRVVRADVMRIANMSQSEIGDVTRRTKVRWRVRRDLSILGDIVRITTTDLSHPNEVLSVDIRRTKALDKAVRFGASYALPFAEFVECVRPFAKDVESAHAYVHNMVDVGLLIPEHHPSPAVDDETECLGKIDPDLANTARAVRFSRLADRIDDPLAMFRQRLTRVSGTELGGDVIVDLVKPLAAGCVGDDVIKELSGVVGVLQRVIQPFRDRRLAEFATSFFRRYEEREVSLMEALDAGRGYDFPLEPPPTVHGGELADWMLPLFEASCRSGAREVMLTEENLPKRTLWQPRDILTVVFRLASEPWSIYDPVLHAQPGTAPFARATAFLPELREQVRALLSTALVHPDDDQSVAEVTQSYPGRLAAVNQFPRLAPRELTLNPVAADPSTSVDVNDLTISVEEGRFVLRSRSDGREVLLYATGAANHNRPESSSVGRFLFAIARDAAPAGGWVWQGIRRASFLPRVCYKAHVLCSMQWLLDDAHTADLRKARGLTHQMSAVSKLRQALDLPRHIMYRERHDHHLPVDLEDSWSVAAWLDIAKPEMRVSEQFPVERSAVRGPGGPYHHELVVPLVTVRTDQSRAAAPPEKRRRRTARLDPIAPGGPVLFLRFAGDSGELLSILLRLYEEVLSPLSAQTALRHWFYLPYSDPDHHVRLRVFGEPDFLHGPVLRALRGCLQPLLETRVVHRVSLDTYERETDRYGGPGRIELCERIFGISSEIAVDFHRSVNVAEVSIGALLVPWVSSLRAMLAATGLPLARRIELARYASALYSPPGGENTQQGRGVRPAHRAGDLYRSIRDALRTPAAALEQVAPQRMSNLRETFTALELDDLPAVGRTQEDLVADLLHVHSVRLTTTWRGDPSLEATAYDVLERTLVTEAALGG